MLYQLSKDFYTLWDVSIKLISWLGDNLEVVVRIPVVVYILIRVEAGKVWDVAQAIGKISGVDRSNVVTGPYDVIAYAVLPSTEDLRQLMEGIHSVDGVTRTETCIAI